MDRELRKYPMLKEIDSKLIQEYISKGDIIHSSYEKGNTIHEQGEECRTLDIVSSGNLIAYSLTESGSETVVFEFKEGSVIGANLLFGDQNKYPMNIFCTTNCSVYHISKEAIMKFLDKKSFVMEFIKSLSLNSQGLNRKIAMFTQKSLRENLLDYLKALSADQKSNNIILPITKKQLADHLGVQRPSLFRELKRMKDEGIIDVDNRNIKIMY